MSLEHRFKDFDVITTKQSLQFDVRSTLISEEEQFIKLPEVSVYFLVASFGPLKDSKEKVADFLELYFSRIQEVLLKSAFNHNLKLIERSLVLRFINVLSEEDAKLVLHI